MSSTRGIESSFHAGCVACSTGFSACHSALSPNVSQGLADTGLRSGTWGFQTSPCIRTNASPRASAVSQLGRSMGRVSKVEMVTTMVLIYKGLLPSIPRLKHTTDTLMEALISL